MLSPAEIQRQYYTETASSYDSMHLSDGDEHYLALRYLLGFMSTLNISSVLDVGSGTGRAVQYFWERGFNVRGVEPVKALIEHAVKKGVPENLFTLGKAESLPFEDNSFDAVCEFGMLHHVAKPEAAVREMMRVARTAVCLSDSNRFGQGSVIARLAKLSLYKLGLWDAANFMKTGGKGYSILDGDGLAYSYSVFDSYNTLVDWADRTILVPTSNEKVRSWYHPLLTSSHVLLCAVKDCLESESQQSY